MASPLLLRLSPGRAVVVIALFAVTAAAAEKSEVRATITPLLGRHYRPGAWLAVRAQAELPPEARGFFTPAVDVLPPQSDIPLFSSRQPAREFAGGEVFVGDFWLMAGEYPPRLRFSLYSESRLAFSAAPAADILRPAEPGWRILLCLSSPPPAPRATHVDETLPQTLPGHAALYESADIIIAGDLSGRPLPLPADDGAFTAIADWLVTGGARRCFDRL